MTHALRRGGLLLYSSTSNLYLYRLLKIYMHQILIYNIKYICIKYWYIISSPFKTSFFSCLFHSPFCGVKFCCPVSNLALLSRMPHAKPTTRQSPPPAVWLLPLLQEGVLTENYAAFKWKLYRLWHGPYVVTNLILHHCPPGCCAQTRCSLTFATRTNKNRDKKIY